jgi:hypothetical protein
VPPPPRTVALEARCDTCGECFNPPAEDALDHPTRSDGSACGGRGELEAARAPAARSRRRAAPPLPAVGPRREPIPSRLSAGDLAALREAAVAAADDAPASNQPVALDLLDDALASTPSPPAAAPLVAALRARLDRPGAMAAPGR